MARRVPDVLFDGFYPALGVLDTLSLSTACRAIALPLECRTISLSVPKVHIIICLSLSKARFMLLWRLMFFSLIPLLFIGLLLDYFLFDKTQYLFIYLLGDTSYSFICYFNLTCDSPFISVNRPFFPTLSLKRNLLIDALPFQSYRSAFSLFINLYLARSVPQLQK